MPIPTLALLVETMARWLVGAGSGGEGYWGGPESQGPHTQSCHLGSSLSSVFDDPHTIQLRSPLEGGWTWKGCPLRPHTSSNGKQ